MGGAVQLWDVRSGPAHAPAATCSIAWSQAAPCGVGAVNDITIHPSRNHLAMAAASHGTVVAWDLRHLHHPLLLFGPSAALPASRSPCGPGAAFAGGDVWEVQFDPLTHLSLLSSARGPNASSTGAAAVPPMLACSDAGLLSLLHPDGTVRDIIHAPHAINSFDVEHSFGQHVVASGHHAIIYVCRPKLP
ncbi:hypothetical protein CLOM_g11457 [Closterium sp. NIES-68]|nr:hypothetical protein CLOM_g12285 [Closterium sp. NIES-68]GJP52332.1 hypothetical protein CLOM_g11457 [Closterium sp. NIES-68]